MVEAMDMTLRQYMEKHEKELNKLVEKIKIE